MKKVSAVKPSSPLLHYSARVRARVSLQSLWVNFLPPSLLSRQPLKTSEMSSFLLFSRANYDRLARTFKASLLLPLAIFASRTDRSSTVLSPHPFPLFSPAPTQNKIWKWCRKKREVKKSWCGDKIESGTSAHEGKRSKNKFAMCACPWSCFRCDLTGKETFRRSKTFLKAIISAVVPLAKTWCDTWKDFLERRKLWCMQENTAASTGDDDTRCVSLGRTRSSSSTWSAMAATSGLQGTDLTEAELPRAGPLWPAQFRHVAVVSPPARAVPQTTELPRLRLMPLPPSASLPPATARRELARRCSICLPPAPVQSCHRLGSCVPSSCHKLSFNQKRRWPRDVRTSP